MSPPPELQQPEPDFIVVNALDTIRAKPRGVEAEEPRFVCKSEYGQVPKYLTAAKLKLQKEKAAREREEALKIQQVCHPRCQFWGRQISEETFTTLSFWRFVALTVFSE